MAKQYRNETAWQMLYGTMSAPPNAIPGLNPMRDPYAFSAQGSAAAYGMPRMFQQSPAAGMIAQFVPQILSMVTGDKSFNNMITPGRGTPFAGDLNAARRSRRIISNLNEGADTDRNRNISQVLQAAGFAKLQSDTAATFATKFLPEMGADVNNVINRVDPAGRASGAALYQSTLIRGDTELTGSTAKAFAEAFKSTYTKDVEIGGRSIRVLDNEAGGGFDPNRIAVIRQQMRARGLPGVGDVLAGSDATSVLSRLANEAQDPKRRASLEALVSQVSSGGIGGIEALSDARTKGFVTENAAENVRKSILKENVEREKPAISSMAKSLKEAGQVFGSIADDVPALMAQIEKMAGNLQTVKPAEVRKALANFKSLVEISGVSAEVLSEQSDIISSRMNVSFKRGTRLATDMNGITAAFQQSGVSTSRARQLSSKFIEQTEADVLNSKLASRVSIAGQYATGEGITRIRQAMDEGDTDFLNNAVSRLAGEGLLTDAEAARTLDRRVSDGMIRDNRLIRAGLDASGIDNQDIFNIPRAAAERRIRDRMGDRFAGASADLAEKLGMESITLRQFGNVAGLSSQLINGGVGLADATAILNTQFGTSMTNIQAGNLLGSFSTGVGLDRDSAIVLGTGGAASDMQAKFRAETGRKQEELTARNERLLKNYRQTTGLPALIDRLKGTDGDLTEIAKGLLEASGFLPGATDVDTLVESMSASDQARIQKLAREAEGGNRTAARELQEIFQDKFGIEVDAQQLTQAQSKRAAESLIGLEGDEISSRTLGLSDDVTGAKGRVSKAEDALKKAVAGVEANPKSAEAITARGKARKELAAARKELTGAKGKLRDSSNIDRVSKQEAEKSQRLAAGKKQLGIEMSKIAADDRDAFEEDAISIAKYIEQDKTLRQATIESNKRIDKLKEDGASKEEISDAENERGAIIGARKTTARERSDLERSIRERYDTTGAETAGSAKEGVAKRYESTPTPMEIRNAVITIKGLPGGDKEGTLSMDLAPASEQKTVRRG